MCTFIPQPFGHHNSTPWIIRSMYRAADICERSLIVRHIGQVLWLDIQLRKQWPQNRWPHSVSLAFWMSSWQLHGHKTRTLLTFRKSLVQYVTFCKEHDVVLIQTLEHFAKNHPANKDHKIQKLRDHMPSRWHAWERPWQVHCFDIDPTRFGYFGRLSHVFPETMWLRELSWQQSHREAR